MAPPPCEIDDLELREILEHGGVHQAIDGGRLFVDEVQRVRLALGFREPVA